MNNQNKVFWDNYYKTNNHDILKSSSFSSFIYENYIKKYNDDNVYLKIADLGSGTSKSSRAKYLEFFRDSSEPLVKININQTNLPDRSGVRKIKILFSRLDAGINLQTWVTLIDFLTPSSAPLGIG